MKTKHTPGPWNVKDSDTVVGPAGNVVAECCGYSDKATTPEQQAQGGRESNARLIAAAPELLEACRLIVLAYGHMDDLTNPYVAAARAAIRKAEEGPGGDSKTHEETSR